MPLIFGVNILETGLYSFVFEIGSHYWGQVNLELRSSRNPQLSVSQVSRNIDKHLSLYFYESFIFERQKPFGSQEH